MLLTITWTGSGTEDLGYLLYKNPYRAQSFELSFGKAYVFYPEVSPQRTTAALLLDINPIDLARGKLGTRDGGLFDYVNDRPYVASSFMSSALSRVFGTAMSGKCQARPELAATPLDLTACLHMLPCRGGEDLPQEIFEPLGYAVETRRYPLDERFPEWGESPYVDLTLRGHVTLAQLLNHLYVLIPVFDRQKHYYISADEIEKLLQHGEGWLSGHPARNRIVFRYLNPRRGLVHRALDRLTETEPTEDQEDPDSEETRSTGEIGEARSTGAAVKTAETAATGKAGEATEAKEAAATGKPSETADPGRAVEDSATGESGAATLSDADAETGESPEKRVTLNTRRLEAVRQAVLDSGASSVLDLGCGEGRLTALLLEERQLLRVGAADVSVRALERAKRVLRYDRMPPYKKQKLTLLQGSVTYKDPRFSGYDAVCLVEVLEHLDPGRIPALERVVFRCAAPATVIVTTPNREYNSRYEWLPQNQLRHRDHRFEWDRAEFRAWTEHVCAAFGYTVEHSEIGDLDEEVGGPTQMGVFRRCV